MPAVDVDAFEFPRPPRPRANHLGGDLSIANAAKRGDWKFERRLVSALAFASVRVPVEEFEVGAQDGVIRAPESVEDDLVDVPLARLRFERLLGQIAIRTPRTFVLGPIRRWKRGHERANGRGKPARRARLTNSNASHDPTECPTMTYGASMSLDAITGKSAFAASSADARNGSRRREPRPGSCTARHSARFARHHSRSGDGAARPDARSLVYRSSALPAFGQHSTRIVGGTAPTHSVPLRRRPGNHRRNVVSSGGGYADASIGCSPSIGAAGDGGASGDSARGSGTGFGIGLVAPREAKYARIWASVHARAASSGGGGTSSSSSPRISMRFTRRTRSWSFASIAGWDRTGRAPRV